MSAEIQTQGSNLPATQNWGAPQEIDTDNIIIPKVLVMQAMSPQVTDGNAKFGELRDSVTGELLGSDKDPMDFVPICIKEEWMVYHLEGKDFVLKERIPYNNSNKKLPREETVNGVQVKRVHNMNFYALLIKDLVAGIDLPKIIPFKITSLRAGKVLYTQMYILNQSQGLSPAGTMMRLTTKKVDGDKGTYMVMEVSPRGKTEPEAVAKAKSWFSVIMSGATKVDDSQEADA